MNVFQMMKQAASMQRELKQIQKGLAQETVEYAGGDGKITVVARGDMTIDSIRLDPACLTQLKPEQLEKRLVSAVNGAMEAAKKKAGKEIAKLTGGLGLGLGA